jgi:hypothetical protein
MNNTEKKLDALIDALGFDVEGKYVMKISIKPQVWPALGCLK